MLAMIVGFGITAFYKHTYSYDYYSYSYWGESDYGRNVLIISYICGLAFTLLGLLLPNKLHIFKSGLMIGGFLTILYAVGYAPFNDVDLKWVFTAVIVGLAILIAVGYYSLVMRKRSRESISTKETDEKEAQV